MEAQLDYEITITHKGSYVHVNAHGIGSYEGAVDLWQQVVDACEQHQCFNVLGEQYLFRNLSTHEALNYPELFKKVGITKKHRIAWVDKNPRTREMTEFCRNILANRLVGNGRLFKDLESAKQWLLGQGPEKSSQ